MDKELNDILRRLRERAQEKRDQAKAAADAEYQADIQSIERLASLGGSATVTTGISNSPVMMKPDKRVGGRKNGPTAAVRAAIGKLGNGFSVASLVSFFEEQGIRTVGRPAIYSSLNKMTQAGEIERIQDPDGNPTPAYRIIELKLVA